MKSIILFYGLCMLSIIPSVTLSSNSADFRDGTHPKTILMGSREPTNILCLLGAPSRSHHIWNMVIFRELADRGHNLTILTTSVDSSSPASPRMHYLHMAGITEAIIQHNYVAPKKSAFSTYLSKTVYGRITARYVEASRVDGLLVDSDAAKQLLDYPEDFHFDLVLHDMHQAQALLGFVYRFGSPPLIALAPSGLPAAAAGAVAGVVNFPSYQPHPEGVYSHHRMTFIERARNLTFFLYDWFYRSYVFMVNENRKARRLFGSLMLDLETIEGKTSVVLANTDFVLDQAVFLPPNVVNVGGLQTQRREALSEELQNFLDNSENGTIYVHLGTNQFENSNHQRFLLVKVFRALSHLNFIWVTAETHLKRLPKNVFASEWVPQNAILAHPKVELMLTNGGRLSVQEAVWHAVPLIVMGTKDQQSQSVRKAIMNGCATALVVDYNAAARVVKTIQNVATSTSYPTVAKKMSQLLRSQPITPLELAVHTIETVLKLGDAAFSQPNDARLNVLQTYLVDVWIVFIVLFISFLLIFINHCCLQRWSRSRISEDDIRRKND